MLKVAKLVAVNLLLMQSCCQLSYSASKTTMISDAPWSFIAIEELELYGSGSMQCSTEQVIATCCNLTPETEHLQRDNGQTSGCQNIKICSCDATQNEINWNHIAIAVAVTFAVTVLVMLLIGLAWRYRFVKANFGTNGRNNCLVSSWSEDLHEGCDETPPGNSTRISDGPESKQDGRSAVESARHDKDQKEIASDLLHGGASIGAEPRDNADCSLLNRATQEKVSDRSLVKADHKISKTHKANSVSDNLVDNPLYGTTNFGAIKQSTSSQQVTRQLVDNLLYGATETQSTKEELDNPLYGATNTNTTQALVNNILYGINEKKTTKKGMDNEWTNSGVIKEQVSDPQYASVSSSFAQQRVNALNGNLNVIKELVNNHLYEGCSKVVKE